MFKKAVYKRTVFIVLCLLPLCYASIDNNKIQEAAYILNIEADTAKATKLFEFAFNSSNILIQEKLNAGLYLAKIAEAKNDTLNVIKYYSFIKNNSKDISLVYTAAGKEKLFRKLPEKIKIARENKIYEHKKDSLNNKSFSRFANCIYKGEISFVQHIVFMCLEDNSLRLVSKNKGTETWSLPFTDKPAEVFVIPDGFFLYYANSLYFYKINDGLDLVWRIYTLEVQDIKVIANKIYILDISGKIALLNKNSGQPIAEVISDGEKFFNPGIGLVGIYQKNGGISVFDTVLTKLFDYQIDGEIAGEPIIKQDSVIFNLTNEKSEILYTKYYQKPEHPLSENSDSLFSLESGNALAWFNLAKQTNSDSSWRRSVIYGARKQELAQIIFEKYAQKIGAKWVKHLPVSSKMLYPQIFNDANNLFISDAEAQTLFKISTENGKQQGEIFLPRDRKYTIVNEESPWLMLSSGYFLSQFSMREQKNILFEIPGKPFSFLRNKNYVYIALWNGFVLKYSLPQMQFKQSVKISSSPVLLATGEKDVYSFSQRKINNLSNAKEINLNFDNANYFMFKNSMFVLASETGMIKIFSKNFEQLGEIFSNATIISLELLEHNNKTYALTGSINQTLSLYEIPSGKHIWSFKSKGSASMQAVLHNSNIWLDQDGAIVAINIDSGKIVKKYPIFGSGAYIKILDNTLFCTTPQKLLYAFPL